MTSAAEVAAYTRSRSLCERPRNGVTCNAY